MNMLQFLQTTLHTECKIQTTDLQGAYIGGNVKISDPGTGENFCGSAGGTYDHSHYTNTASSSASSNATTGGANHEGPSV